MHWLVECYNGSKFIIRGNNILEALQNYANSWRYEMYHIMDIKTVTEATARDIEKWGKEGW
jgi:hypothetical protein